MQIVRQSFKNETTTTKIDTLNIELSMSDFPASVTVLKKSLVKMIRKKIDALQRTL